MASWTGILMRGLADGMACSEYDRRSPAFNLPFVPIPPAFTALDEGPRQGTSQALKKVEHLTVCKVTGGGRCGVLNPCLTGCEMGGYLFPIAEYRSKLTKRLKRGERCNLLCLLTQQPYVSKVLSLACLFEHILCPFCICSKAMSFMQTAQFVSMLVILDLTKPGQFIEVYVVRVILRHM